MTPTQSANFKIKKSESRFQRHRGSKDERIDTVGEAKVHLLLRRRRRPRVETCLSEDAGEAGGGQLGRVADDTAVILGVEAGVACCGVPRGIAHDDGLAEVARRGCAEEGAAFIEAPGVVRWWGAGEEEVCLGRGEKGYGLVGSEGVCCRGRWKGFRGRRTVFESGYAGCKGSDLCGDGGHGGQGRGLR